MKELIFVATSLHELRFESEEDLFEYIETDENGFLNIESVIIEEENISKFLNFIFQTDLTFSKEEILEIKLDEKLHLTTRELEKYYQYWLTISNRENTINEYGMLISLIGYLDRHTDKDHLLVIKKQNLQ